MTGGASRFDSLTWSESRADEPHAVKDAETMRSNITPDDHDNKQQVDAIRNLTTRLYD
jgi:hypothetical protein